MKEKRIYSSLLMKTAIILLFLTALFSCKKKEIEPKQEECPVVTTPIVQYGTLNFKTLKNCNNVKSFTAGDLYLFKTLKDRDNNSVPVYKVKSSPNDSIITIQSQNEEYYYTLYGRTCTNDLITKVGTIKIRTDSTSKLHIII